MTSYNASVPIYLQVVHSIKEKIATGKISPGDKLPSGRELALKYTINPNTAARVYQTLEQEQLLFTRRGLGSFVTEDKSKIAAIKEEMAEGILEEFLAGMERLGISAEEAIEMLKKRNKQMLFTGQSDCRRGRTK